MCGIIGYIGQKNAVDVLLDSLELLEYRGYDSCGISFLCGKENRIEKVAGRVSELRDLVKKEDYQSNIGIGHTRWATHGGVTKENAHPHHQGKVTLVHNGIVENYVSLMKKYQLEDKLTSSTDTEIVAGVMDALYTGDPFAAIKETVEQLNGTYALVIRFEDRPDEIYAIRKVSPIVATKTENEAVLASDLMPLSKFSPSYFVVPEMTVLKMTKEEVTLTDLNRNNVEPQYQEVNWDMEAITTAGHAFFMEKEIYEQPKAVKDTITPRIKDGLPCFEADEVPDSLFESIDNITIVACGTAWHAGLVARNMIEKYTGVKVTVELSSEFIYSSPLIDEKTLLIPISQSGETIDTLEAIRYAKTFGAKALGIINVKGSSMSRICDYRLFTYAGPEIAVASTKAYTSQLAVLMLLTAKLVVVKKKDEVFARKLIKELVKVPEALDQIVARADEIHKLSSKIVAAKDLYMIGRGLDYLSLLEGSLKLKEISYIHSEAYASGELKHGTIALIEQDIPVFGLLTQEKLIVKELSNLKEVVARGAKVYGFVKKAYLDKIDQNFEIFVLPDLDDDFMVFPAVVTLQLVAYYAAFIRGYNVDKPRNLAKVVTVE